MACAIRLVGGLLALYVSGCSAGHGRVNLGDAAVDAQAADGALTGGDADSGPIANADGCYGERAYELSSNCGIYLIRVTRESEDGCRFSLEKPVFDASYLELELDGRWLSHAGHWRMVEMNRVIELLGDACATFQDGQEHSLRATVLCVCVEHIDEQSM